MTPLGQGAMGLAVALGFAVLGTRRTSGMAMLCAAQAVVVAIGALAQGDFGVVLVACAEAGIVVWLGFLLPLPLGEGEALIGVGIGPLRRRIPPVSWSAKASYPRLSSMRAAWTRLAGLRRP